MRQNILTEEELNRPSKMNIAPGSYETFSVNETILDRTHPANISIDGKTFNCIAHYVQYVKCETWGLSKDIIDYVLHRYKAEYPTKIDREYIKFEDDFSTNYFRDIERVPSQYRSKWREICPYATAEAVLSLYEQSPEFKIALNKTKKQLIVEMSPAILWGIDTKSYTNDTISNPINWQGENLYGQVLMAIRDKYSNTIFNKFKAMILSRS